MKKVQLGKSGLFVNPIALGTNYVGGHNLYGDVDEEAGKQLVRTALENGINMLDTAYIYGLGRSEELIGEVMKENFNRTDVVIATKVAHKQVDDEMVYDNSPGFLRKEVEKSLKRLQTDYIDLLYIHFPDKDTPKDEAVGALKQMKDEGKIRSIGLSNFSLEQLKEANKDGYVDVYQGNYNLLSREAEQEIFPYVIEQNLSFIPYFPLAAGLLAGKYTKESTFDDLRADMPHFQGEAFVQNLEKVERLRTIADEKGVETANIALAWYLTREAIDVVIPGAKRKEQVLSNLKTLQVTLTNEEIQEIDRIFQ